MKAQEILSLESRRRIHDYVKKHPGSHLREIARNLNLPLGTALYHLDYLSQKDLVVIRRDGRYKRFFIKHMLGRVEKDYVSAFHHAVPRKIALILLTHGERTQRELCQEVGVSRSTLSFHVKSLVEKGILHCTDQWPENLYRIANPETATNVLTMHEDTFRVGLSERFQVTLGRIARRLNGSGSPPVGLVVSRRLTPQPREPATRAEHGGPPQTSGA